MTPNVVQTALEQLENAHDELLLDFTGVSRIDSPTLRSMEQLAAAARERSVKLVIRGIGVETYKVLKLTAIAAHFSFLP